MERILFLSVLMGVFWTSGSYAGDECAKKYPNSYSSRMACYREHSKPVTPPVTRTTPRSAPSIMVRCRSKWKQDYNMVEYCIRKQTEAKNTLSRLSNGGILQACRRKWKTDYPMVAYCYEKQSSAQRGLSRVPNNEILANCRKKWKQDYSMIRYCVEKQTAAKRNLGL